MNIFSTTVCAKMKYAEMNCASYYYYIDVIFLGYW